MNKLISKDVVADGLLPAAKCVKTGDKASIQVSVVSFEPLMTPKEGRIAALVTAPHLMIRNKNNPSKGVLLLSRKQTELLLVKAGLFNPSKDYFDESDRDEAFDEAFTEFMHSAKGSILTIDGEFRKIKDEYKDSQGNVAKYKESHFNTVISGVELSAEAQEEKAYLRIEVKKAEAIAKVQAKYANLGKRFGRATTPSTQRVIVDDFAEEVLGDQE